MKLQIAMATALVLAGAVLAPQAQGATANHNFTVNINVLTGGSCTYSHAGFFNESYDPATPTPTVSNTNAEVTCSFGTNWTISYDQGLHADAGSSCSSPLRRANSASSFLAYELYRDSARTQPLGCDPSNGLSGTGTGAVQYPGVFSRIPTGQSPTASGAHTDTVVATLTF